MPSDGQKEKGNGQDKAPFKYMVDGVAYESDVSVLTGQQIKAHASIDASFGLFLEGRGQASNQQIGDTQSVDLREPGREHFFTSPPAVYGLFAARISGR